MMRKVIFFLKLYFIILSAVLWVKPLNGQSVLQPDTFLAKVLKYHPLADRASLRKDMATAELLKSKGWLDPSVNSVLQQKYFGGKVYYSISNGELKIPTLYGIDFKAGYDVNRGAYLSPENNTPANGLIYGGISIPVGQGLVIDERRAAIRNALTGLDIGSLEEVDIKNDLLYTATYQYWNWFRSYTVLKTLEEARMVAIQRLDAVKKFGLNGDRPAIDTIEAGIQVQNIELSLVASQLDFQQSQNMLLTFLWNEYKLPIPNNHIPVNVEAALSDLDNDLNTLINGLSIAGHPDLGLLKNKLIQMNTDLKLKKDKLKPKLNIQYNPLSEGIGSSIITDYNINNYKWGLEFKMPLYLRKERGDIKLANLKIQDTQLEVQQKSLELEAKLNNSIAEWQNTRSQIDVVRNNIEQYKQMLDAEKRLFELGESSLFLINMREQAYIQTQIKLADIIAKNRVAYYSIWYHTGRLIEKIPNG
jgi:outer membrane protein TolC